MHERSDDASEAPWRYPSTVFDELSVGLPTSLSNKTQVQITDAKLAQLQALHAE